MSRFRMILLVALAVKLAVLALIAAGPALMPFHEGAYWANFAYPFDEEPSLRSAFKTWDGNHYLFLADHGYQPKHISNAYYPLLPFAMRLARPLALGDPLIAGLIVSTLCCIAAVALLYRLVEETHIFDRAVVDGQFRHRPIIAAGCRSHKSLSFPKFKR